MKDVDSKIEFLNLIEESKGIIYKVCYIYSDEEYSIDDLFQEVVINLWKSYSQFRGDCKSSTWIYRVALNTCISYYRKKRFRPVQIPLTVDIDMIYDDNKIQSINDLYQLINRLSKIDKALILLWLEEKSYSEIADIIGIKVSNVGVKLLRVKEKLKMMSNS